MLLKQPCPPVLRTALSIQDQNTYQGFFPNKFLTESTCLEGFRPRRSAKAWIPRYKSQVFRGSWIFRRHGTFMFFYRVMLNYVSYL